MDSLKKFKRLRQTRHIRFYNYQFFKPDGSGADSWNAAAARQMYGDPGFIGEPINLNVVNADVRDILNYITEQYGINFVIDKSVKAVPVTINVNNVPWNVALDSVLRSQELGVQVNGPILRIAEQKSLADEQAIAQKISR